MHHFRKLLVIFVCAGALLTGSGCADDNLAKGLLPTVLGAAAGGFLMQKMAKGKYKTPALLAGIVGGGFVGAMIGGAGSK